MRDFKGRGLGCSGGCRKVAKEVQGKTGRRQKAKGAEEYRKWEAF
jgi:hypothetical protein